MLEKHKGALLKLVNTYCYRKRDFEDLYQEAEIELVKALDTFDENSGNKFLTYAFTCVKHRIFNCLRQEKRQKHVVSESDRRTVETEDFNNGLENLSEYSHPFEDVDDAEQYKIFEGFMSEKEKDVLKMRLSGQTLNEIGKKFGVTREYIRLIEKKIKTKIEFYHKESENRCIYK